MKNMISKMLQFLARLIAVLFAGLFVISTGVTLIFFNLGQHLFDAELYKQVLVEQQIYQRVPSLLAEIIVSSLQKESCIDNPIACRVDESTDEEKACLQDKLGQEAYQAISSNQRKPTQGEIDTVKSCLPKEQTNILAQASPELQTCYVDKLGDQALEEISSNQHPPTEQEFAQIVPCLREFGRPKDNPVTNSTGELRACLKNSLKPEIFDAISKNQRSPDDAEAKVIGACIAKHGLPEMSADQAAVFLDNLTAKDWEQILTTLLPTNATQVLAEQAINSIFAYFNGDSDSAQLSLIELKRRLSGEAGVKAIITLLDAQPDCTVEEIAKITSSLISDENVVLCNPPAEVLSAIKPLIKSELQVAVNDIPDQVTLIQPDSISDLPTKGPFKGFRFVRLLMQLSPLAPLFFLLAVSVLVIRSLRSWLRWWGIPMLIAGVAGIILAMASMPLFRLAFMAFVAEEIQLQMPQNAMIALRDVIGAFVHALSEPIALQSLIIAGLGLVLLLISFFIKSEIDRETEDLPIETNE